MNKFVATAYLGLVVTASGVFIAEARPAYAQKEAKQCNYCHLSGNGGARNFRGQFYGGNNLNFDRFDETREALLAGVSKDATGADARAKIAYVGNISGAADKQIQLASLRGPVVVIACDKATDASKELMKQVYKLETAYGRNVTFIGIAKTDIVGALKLTDELGSTIRVLPDTESVAAKKFSLAAGWDFAVVAKMGDPLKTYQGISKTNVEDAIKVLAEKAEVEAPTFDATKLPEKPTRGGN